MSLTIAVLTGRRPELLSRTLSSFVAHNRDLWEQAQRVVFHNSGDRATGDVLDGYQWHQRDTHRGRLLPIGLATGRLLDLVEKADTEHVIRLEDDWEIAAPGPWYATGAWFTDALALLKHSTQVRLRLHSEKVARRCVVCRHPIRWWFDEGGYLTHDAHLTWNPSLMRTADLMRTRGARNERAAMRRMHPMPAAQLAPGVFSHIGGRQSLRRNGGAP